MDYFQDLYRKFFSEITQFDAENDLNYTCNVFLSKNMTIIEIDRGWEGIPESLVIQIILCTFLILPFVIFRYLARYKSSKIKSNRTNWVQFIYGDRDIKKKTIQTKNFQLIQKYFAAQENLANILPVHLSGCKNLRQKKNTYGSSSQTIIDNKNHLSPQSSSTSSTTSTNSLVVKNSDSADYVDPDQGKIENENEIPANYVNMPDFNGSQKNLVQPETTFPASRISSVSTVFVNFQKNPINCIRRIFTQLLNISDEDILKNKGRDAYQYLLFQRYVVIFLFILTLVTIVIILPINMHGNNDGKAFARTSVSNIPNDSDLFWAHAICSAFITIVGVFLMNRFSAELKNDDDLMYRKTLLIRHIPIMDNLVEKLVKYFEITMPEVKITGLQLITDVRRLDSLEQCYENAVNALRYSEEINNSSDDDKRFLIRPYYCSQLGCCCFCCCKQYDAVEFYNREKEEIESQIYDELQNIPSRPVRSAFITFETERMSMDVYMRIKSQQKHSFVNCCLCVCFDDNESFDLVKCVISYAPYPDDVNWRDIAFDMKLLWLRKVIISFILFLLFFFLSTPAFLLKIVDLIATKELIKNGIIKPNSIITDFLSPFLLMLLAIILPSIVSYACQMIPYKTISDLNHEVMSRVFAFLLMMIIVLPSTGFLSINAMLGAVLMPSSDQRKFRWHCLFPVDNGAFFVIYVLQAAILGNVAEILRIPELVLYLVYNLFLRSPAEYEKARKWVTFDFPFGVSYPRFLLIFTMTIIYSFACPLIAPCGLLYMIGKHIVDRYNIYHVYQPTKINRRIHSSAILYVHVGLILMQFQLFTVIIIKTQYSKITFFVLIMLIISLLTLAFYNFRNCFLNLIHMNGSINARRNKARKDYCVCSYTPPVLYKLMDHGLFQPKPNQIDLRIDEVA